MRNGHPRSKRTVSGLPLRSVHSIPLIRLFMLKFGESVAKKSKGMLSYNMSYAFSFVCHILVPQETRLSHSTLCLERQLPACSDPPGQQSHWLDFFTALLATFCLFLCVKLPPSKDVTRVQFPGHATAGPDVTLP